MAGEMFVSFLIVSVVCLTVLVIIKMALRHSENMKRISHGYPTIDDPSRERSVKRDAYGESDRLQ